MDEAETLTAWHEAGHATMAIIEGGFIEHVTLEPPNDEGPQRYGETISRWPSQMSQNDLLKSEVMVSLAGPVVEMLYSDQRQKIADVEEWKADWIRAVASARSCTKTDAEAAQMLQRSEEKTLRLFDISQYWSAVSAIAEELLAHSTIEHEQVHDTFSFWQRRC